MPDATIFERPTTFDRVDRVKQVVGQSVLPGDERFWILGSPLVLIVDDVERISIPKGFTTDGASIPPFVQWLTGWGCWEDPQRWAAICHDWLYCMKGVVRKRADLVFKAVLSSEGAGWLRRETMYYAVRIGGWPAYRANQRNGPRIFA